MATYLLNILPSKTKANHTPTYLLYRTTPSYSHLRTFGCLCYPLLPSTTIHKLQNRSKPCVFLGYPANHRGYKCLDLSSMKIVISRHVLFAENVFPFKSHTSLPTYDFLHEKTETVLHPSLRFPPPPPTPVESGGSPSVPPPPATPARFGQVYTRRPAPTQPPSTTTDSLSTPPFAPPTSSQQPISPQQPSPSTSSTTTSPSTTPPTPPPPPPPHRMQTRSMTGHAKPRIPFNLHASSSIEPLPKNIADALSNPTWKHAMQDEFSALRLGISCLDSHT